MSLPFCQEIQIRSKYPDKVVAITHGDLVSCRSDVDTSCALFRMLYALPYRERFGIDHNERTITRCCVHGVTRGFDVKYCRVCKFQRTRFLFSLPVEQMN